MEKLKAGIVSVIERGRISDWRNASSELADQILTLIEKSEPSAQSPAAMAGYGAKPLKVIGGMAIIVSQRHSECKECKWHPDVCEYCEINKWDNERIEKEMAP